MLTPSPHKTFHFLLGTFTLLSVHSNYIPVILQTNLPQGFLPKNINTKMSVSCLALQRAFSPNTPGLMILKKPFLQWRHTEPTMCTVITRWWIGSLRRKHALPSQWTTYYFYLMKQRSKVSLAFPFTLLEFINSVPNIFSFSCLNKTYYPRYLNYPILF